jgi:hypothetical protein
MKRASLISVVLTVALAIACSTANKVGPDTANPGIVSIAVVVVQDPTQTDPVVEVTYPSFATAGAQKIRWCVYNNTKWTVTVSILLPVGSTLCVTNPPALVDIPPGNNPAMCTDICDCGGTPNTYPYTVDVTTTSGGHGINPNPRVILN